MLPWHFFDGSSLLSIKAVCHLFRANRTDCVEIEVVNVNAESDRIVVSSFDGSLHASFTSSRAHQTGRSWWLTDSGSCGRTRPKLVCRLCDQVKLRLHLEIVFRFWPKLTRPFSTNLNPANTWEFSNMNAEQSLDWHVQSNSWWLIQFGRTIANNLLLLTNYPLTCTFLTCHPTNRTFSTPFARSFLITNSCYKHFISNFSYLLLFHFFFFLLLTVTVVVCSIVLFTHLVSTTL